MKCDKHNDAQVEYENGRCPLCLALEGVAIHKLGLATAMLDEGAVSIHVNPKVPGVDIPEHLRDNAAILLIVGHNMPTPIPDFEYDVRGIRGTLSFEGKPYHVDVRWEGIYGMTNASGQSVMWRHRMPEAVWDQISKASQGSENVVDVGESKSEKPPKARPVFGVIDGGKEK